MYVYVCMYACRSMGVSVRVYVCRYILMSYVCILCVQPGRRPDPLRRGTPGVPRVCEEGGGWQGLQSRPNPREPRVPALSIAMPASQATSGHKWHHGPDARSHNLGS